MGSLSTASRRLLVLGMVFVVPVSAVAGGFLRGDVDGKLDINIGDAVRILRFLLDGEPLPCKDAADVNDDGAIELSDAIQLLTYLFDEGPTPSPPFPERCAADPTDDDLDCQVITEGDGIFYVIDRSGGFAGTGGFAVAKREVIRSVNEFSSCVELGILFFDSSIFRFPSDGVPITATADARQAAIGFVASAGTGAGSCVREALLAALDFADQSTAKRKVIVYLGDGGGTCQGADEATYLKLTLDAVRERNQGEVQINAICVLDCSTLGEQFLKRLAAESGGTYTRIVR